MVEVVSGMLKVCKSDILPQMWIGLAGISENSISKLGKLFTDLSWSSTIYFVLDPVF